MPYKQSAYISHQPGDYAREWRKKTGAIQKIRLEQYSRPRTEPLYEQPTTLVQSVRSLEREAPMSLDEQNRPYLLVTNPYEDTVDLAESLLLKYRDLRGEYPTVIILSALRYLLRPGDHFIIGHKRIPYIHDISVSVIFDVAVRGGS